jgi:CHAD domain-containing protein
VAGRSSGGPPPRPRKRLADPFLLAGVAPKTPVGRAAGRILADRSGPLFRLEARASSSDDADAVHDMRVASRRMREALGLFAPVYPAKDLRRWQKTVRKVTASLGAVRDADVFIDAFAGLLASSPSGAERVALAYLIGLRQGERKIVRERMGRRISRLGLAKSRKDFVRFAGRPRKVVLARAPLTELAARALPERAETAFGFLGAALTPENVESQHAMRIAMKRLRYAMESLACVLGPDFDPLYRAVRGFQDALGELHDADVFAEAVRAARADERVLAAGVTAAGLDGVSARLAAERKRRFAAFKTLAGRHPEAAVRARLEKALAAALGTAS